MTYDELAMTLIDALGLSDQKVTELTLNFRAQAIPLLSVTLEILEIDADTKLHKFGESLKHFELRQIDEPEQEEAQ